MKVILLASVGSALADMVVFDAAQVPTTEDLLQQLAGWIGGEINALAGKLGLSILTADRGQQLASPGDWIVSDPSGPLHVLSDDTFKTQYAEAPDGAGVAPAEPAGLNMPAWQSHRVVHAAPIGAIDGLNVTLAIDGGPVFAAPADFFARYQAVVGDYLMQYDDGYMSVCPKAAFEDGYSPYTPPAPETQQAA